MTKRVHPADRVARAVRLLMEFTIREQIGKFSAAVDELNSRMDVLKGQITSSCSRLNRLVEALGAEKDVAPAIETPEPAKENP